MQFATSAKLVMINMRFSKAKHKCNLGFAIDSVHISLICRAHTWSLIIGKWFSNVHCEWAPELKWNEEFSHVPKNVHLNCVANASKIIGLCVDVNAREANGKCNGCVQFCARHISKEARSPLQETDTEYTDRTRELNSDISMWQARQNRFQPDKQHHHYWNVWQTTRQLYELCRTFIQSCKRGRVRQRQIRIMDLSSPSTQNECHWFSYPSHATICVRWISQVYGLCHGVFLIWPTTIYCANLNWMIDFLMRPLHENWELIVYIHSSW